MWYLPLNPNGNKAQGTNSLTEQTTGHQNAEIFLSGYQSGTAPNHRVPNCNLPFIIYIDNLQTRLLSNKLMKLYLISTMPVGYRLEAQMQMFQEPALFVDVHLMITPHAVDVPIAECLFWSVVVARYDPVISISPVLAFFVCISLRTLTT